MSKKILLICFDTPYPDNYGGAVDMERKFQFFRENGFKIDLVCSSFNPERTQFFERFVENNRNFIQNYHIQNIDVNYLKIPLLFNPKPFSVQLRKFDFQNIKFIHQQKYDMVLVEHLKSTLNIKKLKKSLQNSPKFWLRMHNDEAEYYGNLIKVEPNLLKKIFYLSEHFKYRFYQSKTLKSNVFDGVLYISSRDKNRLEKSSHSKKQKKHLLLPIYQKKINPKVAISKKKIDFLYIGNLDLNDNFDALKEITKFLKFHKLDKTNICIVGKCSEKIRENEVKTLFSGFSNVQFYFNANHERLEKSYDQSKFFLNFSSNKSGVKTKLIEAINHLIPVISNDDGVNGSGYEKIVLDEKQIISDHILHLISDENAYLDFYKNFESQVIEKSEEVDKIYHQWLNENYG